MRRHRELILELAFAALATACSADTFTASDASADAGDAATSDASGGGADASPAVPSVSCGASACTNGDTCCVYTSAANDGGLSVSMTCNAQCPAPNGNQQLATFDCTSTADCGSGVCCIHRQNNVDVSACAPACNSGNNEVQMCDPLAADAGCAPNQPCSTANIADWNLPSTFATCGGHGVP